MTDPFRGPSFPVTPLITLLYRNLRYCWIITLILWHAIQIHASTLPGGNTNIIFFTVLDWIKC